MICTEPRKRKRKGQPKERKSYSSNAFIEEHTGFQRCWDGGWAPHELCCTWQLSSRMPSGGGGGGEAGSKFPASRTVYSRFPPPSLVAPAFVRFFLLRKIVQCCENYFLFHLSPVPLGIPSPVLSSPVSSKLPAPITSGLPPLFPSTPAFCKNDFTMLKV